MKGSNLLDIYSIITRPEVRRHFMKIARDKDFLEFLENLDNFTPDDISSTRRTLSFIRTNKILNSMFCSRNPTFSLYDAFREGKIILVDGERGKVGDKVSTFILSTILTMFWIYMQGRNNKNISFIFCDEFQEYYNSSFSDMLILGRKENLNLFMVTTHLSTISFPIRESIMANTKNFALFRLSPTDALEFSEKFSISKEKLIFTDPGTAFIKSSTCADFARIEQIQEIRKGKEFFIEKSRKHVSNDYSYEEIVMDLKLLEYLHLEKNEGNIEKINEIVSENRNIDIFLKITEEKKKAIEGKIFDGKRGIIIEKLLSMGNVVRYESKNPLILRCIPFIPNIYSEEFYVYVDTEGNEKEISIFTGEKNDCDNCFTLNEFLSLNPHSSLLRDISGICLGYEGELITTSKRIADALREYSENYKNFIDLERTVRKVLLDSGYAVDWERKIIDGERIKTLKIDTEKMRIKFKKYNFRPSLSLEIK